MQVQTPVGRIFLMMLFFMYFIKKSCRVLWEAEPIARSAKIASASLASNRYRRSELRRRGPNDTGVPHRKVVTAVKSAERWSTITTKVYDAWRNTVSDLVKPLAERAFRESEARRKRNEFQVLVRQRFAVVSIPKKVVAAVDPIEPETKDTPRGKKPSKKDKAPAKESKADRIRRENAERLAAKTAESLAQGETSGDTSKGRRRPRKGGKNAEPPPGGYTRREAGVPSEEAPLGLGTFTHSTSVSGMNSRASQQAGQRVLEIPKGMLSKFAKGK